MTQQLDVFDALAVNHHVDDYDHTSTVPMLEASPHVAKYDIIDPSGVATDVRLYVLPCAITLQTYMVDNKSHASWDLGGPDQFEWFKNNTRDHGLKFAMACVLLQTAMLTPELTFCPAPNSPWTAKGRAIVEMATDYVQKTGKFDGNWKIVQECIDVVNAARPADQLGSGLNLSEICNLIHSTNGGEQTCAPQA